MEGLCHRATVGAAKVTLAVVLILPMAAGDAHAYRRRTSTNATTSGTGVDLSIREVRSGGGSSSGGATGVTCTYEQITDFGTPRTPSRTHVFTRRTCSNGVDEFFWVEACDYFGCGTPAPRPDPIDLAREARDHLPVHGGRIVSNPRRGLVGVRTWFWIETDDAVLAESLSAFGMRIDAQASPVSYRWTFGDGTERTTSSPGQPYPRRSPVTHTYERSSAGLAAGYEVTVTTVYQVRWRVGGGAWRSLPGISRTSTRFYRVAESQAVNSSG